jgi:hypothetical protein
MAKPKKANLAARVQAFGYAQAFVGVLVMLWRSLRIPRPQPAQTCVSRTITTSRI